MIIFRKLISPRRNSDCLGFCWNCLKNILKFLFENFWGFDFFVDRGGLYLSGGCTYSDYESITSSFPKRNSISNVCRVANLALFSFFIFKSVSKNDSRDIISLPLRYHFSNLGFISFVAIPGVRIKSILPPNKKWPNINLRLGANDIYRIPFSTVCCGIDPTKIARKNPAIWDGPK